MWDPHKIWTTRQQYGPNHLGWWYNVLPPVCVPQVEIKAETDKLSKLHQTVNGLQVTFDDL